MGLLIRFATTTAATLLLLVAAAPLLVAQDAEKPGKKPPTKDMKDAKKGDDGEEKEKPAPILDEKQKKVVDKIRKDVEGKFKKSKKEQTHLYVLIETKMEELPPPDMGPDGPAKGRNPGGPGGKGPKRQANGGAGALGGGGSGQLAEYVTRDVKRKDDRAGAVDEVVEFLTKYPPAPKGKKQAAAEATPHRTWQYVGAYPKTAQGDKSADVKEEELKRNIDKLNQQQAMRFKKNG